MEYLVSRGHQYEDIVKKYTMEQISVFAEGGRVNRVMEMIDYSIAMRSANAGDKDWKKYIDSMRNVIGPPEKVEQKVMSRAQADMLRNLLAGKMRAN